MFVPTKIKLRTNLAARPREYQDNHYEAFAKVNANLDALADEILAGSISPTWKQPALTATLSEAPTVAVEEGMRFLIVSEPPLGDPWEGHLNDVAVASVVDPAIVWQFETPAAGWRLAVLDLNAEFVFSGTAWIQATAMLQHDALPGVNGGATNGAYHLSLEEYKTVLAAIGKDIYSPRAMCIQFNEASPVSEVVAVTPPEAVITRMAVYVTDAAVAGAPTISLGDGTDPERYMESTVVDLTTAGAYEKAFALATAEVDGGEDLGPCQVYLYVTPDSQTFHGNLFLQYEPAEWVIIDGGEV